MCANPQPPATAWTLSNSPYGVDESDVILGLDIATTTGYAVLTGGHYIAGEITFNRDKRLSQFRDWLVYTIKQNRPAIVVTERTFINKRMAATEVLLCMRGVALEVLERCISFHIDIVNTDVKKAIAGRSLSSQEKKGGAMIRALEQYGYRVKGINAADALAVALAGKKQIFGGGL